MLDSTMTFSLERDRESDIRRILTTVYDALKRTLRISPPIIMHAASFAGLTGMSCYRCWSNRISESDLPVFYALERPAVILWRQQAFFL